MLCLLSGPVAPAHIEHFHLNVYLQYQIKSLLKFAAVAVQLKQSLLSLHAITSPPAAAVGGDSAVAAAAAAGNPLDAVMSTNAVAQTKSLVEQLQQEEAALQLRLAEIDAVQQYQQVRLASLTTMPTLCNFGLSCLHVLRGAYIHSAKYIQMYSIFILFLLPLLVLFPLHMFMYALQNS